MPIILVILLPVFWFFSQPASFQLQWIGATLLALTIIGYYGAKKRREYEAAVMSFGWSDNIDPREFERRCAIYLRKLGWNAKTTKGSGDQGVDVLAEKAGVRVVFQCKRYSRPVGNAAVQEAIAGMVYAGASRAAVVSNAAYTPAAKLLARRSGVLLLHYTDLRNADALFGVEPPQRRVVRNCQRCGLGLRLPKDISGKVRCPRCGVASQHSTY